MVISVASGKGGTGKTTVAVNLAFTLRENVQIVDCDVEEPNSGIFIAPKITRIIPVNVLVPQVDKSKCTFCGRCSEVCQYHAIVVFPPKKTETRTVKGKVLIFPNLCHSCGGCKLFCPNNAIKEIERQVGEVSLGSFDSIQFAQGRLNLNEVASPAVIRKVKQYIDSSKTVIIDAPPGTSCPVIEAVKDSDFCILASEPTPFGLNDLVLAVEVLRKLKIPFGVVINRYGLGDGRLEDYCAKENIPVLMKLPYDKKIAEVYSQGKVVVERIPEYKNVFFSCYRKIKELLGEI